MAREHFFYGALVGAGAVVLGCGASLATFGLWRLAQVSEPQQWITSRYVAYRGALRLHQRYNVTPQCFAAPPST